MTFLPRRQGFGAGPLNRWGLESLARLRACGNIRANQKKHGIVASPLYSAVTTVVGFQVATKGLLLDLVLSGVACNTCPDDLLFVMQKLLIALLCNAPKVVSLAFSDLFMEAWHLVMVVFNDGRGYGGQHILLIVRLSLQGQYGHTLVGPGLQLPAGSKASSERGRARGNPRCSC